MPNVKSPEEMQRLMATARQNPRPSYFSTVTLANEQISHSYETYLITLDNSAKRELVNRLRKALDQCDTGLDRDAMASMAARFEMSTVNAQADEIGIALGDYTGFSRTQIQDGNYPENAELVESVGSAMGSRLFQRNQCENEIISLGMTKQAIDGSTGLANKKRQIQSWIAIINTYITKA